MPPEGMKASDSTGAPWSMATLHRPSRASHSRTVWSYLHQVAGQQQRCQEAGWLQIPVK